MFKKIIFIGLAVILSTSSAFAGEGSSKISVMPAPPDLTVSVEFIEPSGNKILDAEETGTVRLTVSNSGKGDAFDVVVEIRPDKSVKGLFYDSKISLGTIPSGKKITQDISLKTSEELPTENITFNIKIIEANGFDADPVRIAFKIKSFEPPKLVIADVGIDDQNANSRVEPMENVQLTIRVQNIGHGDARNVVLDITSGENVYIGGAGKTHFDIGNLRAGEFKDITFMFYTNKRINNGDEIPLSVSVNEARPQFKIAKALGLTMNARQKNIKELVVEGIEAPKGDIKLAKGLSVDIEQDLPRTKNNMSDAFAVIIGNSEYRKVKAVEFAVNDAQAMKLYLIEALGFKEGNIFTLNNATKGDFELYFGNDKDHKGKLFNNVKPGKSDVFVHYSGHGAPGLKDKKGYFVPVDADPAYVEMSGYSAEVFYRNLSKIPAKSMTVVLDACFSGATVHENISPILLEIDNPVINLKNGIVLSSSSGTEVSSWYSEKRHGMFTYFFLKAIHNKNADLDKNNELTFDEIYKYIADKTEGVPYYARSINGVDQTPTIEGQYHDRVLVKY